MANHALLKASPSSIYNHAVPKQRLDSLLLGRGLAENKSKARAAVGALLCLSDALTTSQQGV